MLQEPCFALLLLAIAMACTPARGQEGGQTVTASQTGFEPTRYRPIPTAIDGLKSHEFSLDGTWRLDPAPVESVHERPLAAKAWSDFHVPGQWAEQGFDVPQDKPVAMAKEFTIPKDWAGYRIFLRFDAIHAGTDYWLNGQKLGYSENLFTPVWTRRITTASWMWNSGKITPIRPRAQAWRPLSDSMTPKANP